MAYKIMVPILWPPCIKVRVIGPPLWVSWVSGPDTLKILDVNAWHPNLFAAPYKNTTVLKIVVFLLQTRNVDQVKSEIEQQP